MAFKKPSPELIISNGSQWMIAVDTFFWALESPFRTSLMNYTWFHIPDKSYLLDRNSSGFKPLHLKYIFVNMEILTPSFWVNINH